MNLKGGVMQALLSGGVNAEMNGTEEVDIPAYRQQFFSQYAQPGQDNYIPVQVAFYILISYCFLNFKIYYMIVTLPARFLPPTEGDAPQYYFGACFRGETVYQEIPARRADEFPVLF